MTSLIESPYSPPPTFPLPEGRPRWRLTLHNRAFAQNIPLASLLISEIMGARSIRIEQQLNKPTTITFSVEGRAPATKLIRELMTDVVAWRWDERVGEDIPIVRAIVTQSQDILSAQVDTVNFTAKDYTAMLERRYLVTPYSVANQDQDSICAQLVMYSVISQNPSLNPGSFLPLWPGIVTPDGSNRPALSGRVRDRTYKAGQSIYEAVENLSNVQYGFDFDVTPALNGSDVFRIWYPYRGVIRDDVVLEYGSTIADLNRSANSANYANYVRVIGDTSNPDDPNAPPMYAERWNADANNITVAPVGLWQQVENAPDVRIQSTLDQQAQGSLDALGVLVPTYYATLRPGYFRWGRPNLGDTVRLVVQAGRLDIVTEMQVVAFTFVLSEEGTEEVSVGLGRADITFQDLFTERIRDVNALARR